MTSLPALPPLIRDERLNWILACAGVALAVAIIIVFGHPHPHAPHLALLARQPLAIKLHLACALAALLIGSAQMARIKGDRLHRILGWSWVALMGATAASSFFVRTLNPGHFSLIHGLSAYVLIALPIAVIAARRGEIAAHRGWMTGLYAFALLVAGAFTFAPGRLMWALFLG